MSTADAIDLGALRAAFAGNLLADAADMAPYLTDWRRRWTGRARCVVQPDSTRDVAAVVRWCAEHGVPIVPQGGNTGLSGGATPDTSGRAIVVSLLRLNRIRNVDAHNSSITAEAGCLLHEVQEAADSAGRLFPLSLAAEGSCTIGGNLATNAGGTGVLRYGNARDLCLGLEVVTAVGDVWNGLTGLRKNNAGYDLRDLIIGSEGTLGIITAAVLRLHAKPRGRAVAFLAVASVQRAVELLDLARDTLDSRLTAFEMLSDACLGVVLEHHAALRAPVGQRLPWYALVEVSDVDAFAKAEAALSDLLASAFERDLIADGVVATSMTQAESLWALRENVSESLAREGPAIKHDISLPISGLAAFIESTNSAIERRWPDVRLMVFGHVGDGNLHYNLAPGRSGDHVAFMAHEPQINRFVHEAVAAANGSISAEHGLGVLRRDEAAHFKSAVELRLTAAIKRALDPDGLMNPGKVLPSCVS